MSLSIRLDNQASPLLARIRSAAEAKGLVLVAAREVAVGVRKHLVALNQERHRAGVGDSFYGRAAKSVAASQAGSDAVVGVAQRGFRLRRLGGIVRPGPGKKMVAYAAEGAGRAAVAGGPRDFNDLEISRQINPAHGGLQLCLIRRASTALKFSRRRQKDGSIRTRIRAGAVLGGEVVFWLARKTTHKADATVLPTDATMQGQAVEGIRQHMLTLELRRADGLTSTN